MRHSTDKGLNLGATALALVQAKTERVRQSKRGAASRHVYAQGGTKDGCIPGGSTHQGDLGGSLGRREYHFVVQHLAKGEEMRSR
jgi:hypothetical protein